MTVTDIAKVHQLHVLIQLLPVVRTLQTHVRALHQHLVPEVIIITADHLTPVQITDAALPTTQGAVHIIPVVHTPRVAVLRQAHRVAGTHQAGLVEAHAQADIDKERINRFRYL